GRRQQGFYSKGELCMEEQVEKVDVCKEHPVVKTLGWLVTGACLLWVGWMARGLMPKRDAGGMPPEVLAMMKPGGPPTVVVKEVEAGAVNTPYEYIGMVEPVQDVELRAQIDGYVLEVHFSEGSVVKRGDPLFTIDAERYQARVDLRKAEIVMAEAELERAESYLKRLEASDARAITQKDFDKARADAAQGRAAVMQAKANLALAEIDLKDTRIIAPVSGRVGRTVANVGDYVSPALGTLVRIVQTDPIRVAFAVTDKDFIKMRENIADGDISKALRIRLRLPTGTVPDMTGERDYEDNVMSAETATMLVRARFSNGRGLLVPNGYVTVLVDMADPAKSAVLPQEALLSDKDGSFVYVVDGGGKAEKRRVATGAIGDGIVAVTGVDVGEKVVVRGVQKVVPGQPVHLAGEVPAQTGEAANK
ncbi:MAG: efflux RND transporter periplasmic adaptor subunit, partial [Kiritimatiellae bacterium]|nr:efflux RND transporter periplasmic adaptor subunit [Kiritimatiellia bacterium]